METESYLKEVQKELDECHRLGMCKKIDALDYPMVLAEGYDYDYSYSGCADTIMALASMES